ncbi:cytidylyltransferase domain-containing protein [Shewanella holmiensis]|uniref:Acylneuraminate cytidylyltransferase family protein n=1 Tax=Shewanella holmiensis TaxID=2952222 RepID=A0A9X2WLP3_9GAMM|nr:acylneuraminate cytidylyltransferase family protein [Shewanella holmiensis]MCT7941662.1 acylneuraminate cytidylyltransferase family protein [Shewanella holmiensis]
MKTFAFIFARGGSKGLPRKNIKLLQGKPLINYSIESAILSPLIDRVFVSTEDEEIAKIATQAGAEVIIRPAELASDTSAEWLSWQHACLWVKEKYGDFDYFVSLPATSPLRSNDDITAAIVAISSEKTNQIADFDACISVTPANRSPFFNMVVVDTFGQVSMVNPLHGKFTRRQDVPAVFDITTVVYSTTPEYVLSSESLFNGRVTSIEVPKERAIDIDDIYDFMMAETILKERAKNAF